MTSLYDLDEKYLHVAKLDILFSEDEKRRDYIGIIIDLIDAYVKSGQLFIEGSPMDSKSSCRFCLIAMD